MSDDAPFPLVRNVALAAASTGLGTIPLHRAPRPVRSAYVLVPAVLSSGAMLLGLRRARATTGVGVEVEAGPAPEADGRRDGSAPGTAIPEPGPYAAAPQDGGEADEPAEAGAPGPGMPARRELALALGAGALVAGVGILSLRIDRGVENALVRREVPVPRVWMGIAAGMLSLGMSVLEDRIPDVEG